MLNPLLLISCQFSATHFQRIKFTYYSSGSASNSNLIRRYLMNKPININMRAKCLSRPTSSLCWPYSIHPQLFSPKKTQNYCFQQVSRKTDTLTSSKGIHSHFFFLSIQAISNSNPLHKRNRCSQKIKQGNNTVVN